MLPRPYRLKERRAFAQVYRRGSAAAYPAFVLYQKPNGGRTPRIGFSVSKKLGNAVERNRLKRRFRHAVAERLSDFPPGFDYVFVARAAAHACDHDRLAAALGRAAAVAQEKTPAQEKARRAARRPEKR